MPASTVVIHQDGFELYGNQFALAMKYEEDGFDNIGISTGRSGGNSSCAFIAGGLASYQLNVNVTPRYDYTVQCAIKFSNLAPIQHICILSSLSGYAWVTVGIDSNGTYYISTYSGVFARATVSVPAAVWHHVCVQVRLNAPGDSSPSASVHLYVNLALVASLTNVTINPDVTNSIGLISWQTQATCSFYVDDAWIAYNTDNTPVTPCDYVVERLMPVSDFDTLWDMSPSNSPSRASLVSEIPPDSDRGYIYSSNYGAYQTFNVHALSLIPSVVQSVRVAVCGRKEGPGNSPFSVGAAIYTGSYVGSSTQSDLTPQYAYYDNVFNTQATGGLWSASNVATSQFGVWTTT
jgi:hypothetical protein